MKAAFAPTLALMFAAALGAHPAAAQLRLPRMLGDHAVLQRERPMHVWGWDAPDAKVAVAFHGRAAQGVADRLGRWEVWLPPEPAGGPYALTVTDDLGGSATLRDVMVGDVWFASGQSNMEMPLAGFPPSAHVADAAAEIAAADNPRIRLLNVRHRSSPFPLRDGEDGWSPCTPATAARFSAVGYFFARALAAREHVTIGVIDASWGGTPADSWVSLEGLAADPALLPAFAARARLEHSEADKAAIAAAEEREDALATTRGQPLPKHDWRPDERSWRPSELYNGMVAPFTGYGLTGVIWYQGETNSDPARAPYYETLFEALITDWRRDFAQGDLPFLYAQISSFDSPKEQWGLVRDAQRRALRLRATAMAVTTDVGDPLNVHPSDKQTVAARLALGARAVAYGEPVAYAPPLYRQATSEGLTGMRVWFENGAGLKAQGGRPTGFELGDETHRFVPATARVEGDSVLVTSALPRPAYVRYNWGNVVRSEIYNAAGLPASTFTSEETPAPSPSL